MRRDMKVGEADIFVWRQVGNEFGAVEALWSQFEGVMAKDREADAKDGKEEEEEEEETAGEEEEEGEEGGDTVVEGNGEER